jgi:hypothetical protein
MMDFFIVLLVGESCSLEQMISRVFGKADLGQYGLKWLQKNFLGEIAESRELHIDFGRNESKQVNQTFIYDKELDQYRYYHPYMFQRGFDEKIIELFDIGYDDKNQCLTFPILDKDGNCLFIARRSVNTKWFNYPNSVIKPLYGLYQLYQLKEFPKEVYITESMTDCITLWQHNKYALALNGLGTKNQFEQLNKLPCRKYILATDNDDAGIKARQRIRENIHNKIITEIKLPAGRKDINECIFEEIENLCEIF